MSQAKPLTDNLNLALIDLSRRDPALANIYKKYGAPPRWSRKPGYATLVRIILEQQVSLLSARAIYKKLSSSLGRVTPLAVINAGDEKLRKIGLTRQKSRYCLALANTIVSKELDLDSHDCEDDDELLSMAEDDWAETDGTYWVVENLLEELDALNEVKAKKVETG